MTIFFKQILLSTTALVISSIGILSQELPLPTGNYHVGTLTAHLVDKSRKDTIKPAPSRFRELMVQFWYPTDQQRKTRSAPYLPYARVVPAMVNGQ